MENHSEAGAQDGLGSVSRLIPRLREGNPAAIGQLWERFETQLVQRAQARLRAVRGGAESAEEVAIDAVMAFAERLGRPDADRRFPGLDHRDDLWKYLACFAWRKAGDLARREARRQVIVAGESALGSEGLHMAASLEPLAECHAQVDERLAQLDPDLRDVALRKLAGYTNAEIASALGWSLSKVERKLRWIRILWEDDAPGRR